MTLRAMHFVCTAAAIACATSWPAAQSLLLKPSAVQHVTAVATVAPGASASRAMLQLDVTPNPNIHVYAAGAKEFTPVALILTPQPGVTVGKAVYPRAGQSPAIGGASAPAYGKPFRITQPITLTRATGAASGATAKKDPVVIAGVLNYQACDDRLCYPVASLPVSWTLK